MISRYPFDRIIRTVPGNGTLVAIQASVMPYLQMQGPVPKGRTPFHTFSAPNTKIFIDGKFEKWFFNEAAIYGRGRTELIFSSRIQIRHARFEVSPT